MYFNPNIGNCGVRVQAWKTRANFRNQFTLAALPSKKFFSSTCAAQRDLFEVEVQG